MRADGLDFGNEVLVQVTRGFAAAGAGSATLIPLDKMVSNEGGLPLAVKGFLVEFPLATFDPGASKVVDGIAAAEAMAKCTVRMADGSAAAALGRQEIVPNVDGPRFLTALEFMAGVPTVLGAGGPIIQHGAGDADSTTATFSLGSFTASMRGGPLQFQGPYGEGDGTQQNIAYRPRFFLPLHMRDGEDDDAFAMPANQYTGEPGDGCSGQSGSAPGSLSFTQASTIANQAITWGSEGFNVWAVCVRTAPDVRPAPLVPFIKTHALTGQELRLTPGLITAFLAFCKPLTGAGAMATHDYTDVSTWAGATRLHWNESSVHLRAIGYTVRREAWRPTYTETAISNALTTRYSRGFYPLVLNDKSLLRGGSDEQGLRVQIATTGETTHHILEAGYLMHTDGSDRAHEKFHGPGARVVANTRNGNEVPPVVSRHLPRRTVRRG